MLTKDTTEGEKDLQIVNVKAVRGWRFYGTFACLALLNLICAIDATILSVALPVMHARRCFDIILMILPDNSHESEVDGY